MFSNFHSYMYVHNFYFLIFTANISKPQCPASHPNVYYNGDYCCQTNKEKVYTPQGSKCDGSVIQKDSLCCKGNQYTACPSGNCENYQGLDLRSECFRFYIIAFLSLRKGVIILVPEQEHVSTLHPRGEAGTFVLSLPLVNHHK